MSMAPAPSPSGTANIHKSHRFPETEKPSNATAVNAVLKAENFVCSETVDNLSTEHTGNYRPAGNNDCDKTCKGYG